MELAWNKSSPFKDATIITTLDAHAAGEPLRIITGGLPEVKGATILERRRYMLEHLDYIRHALMWEPRGHNNMYGCVITEPVSTEADLGVLFMHNEGYSTMCGHGIIALVTALLETGAFPAKGSSDFSVGQHGHRRQRNGLCPGRRDATRRRNGVASRPRVGRVAERVLRHSDSEV